MKKRKVPKPVVGWCEWAQLPELGVEQIKVKIDTGARTSSLHVFDIQTFSYMGRNWVQFDVHPIQDNDLISHTCVCPIIDCRMITSSTGHRQKRYIIETMLQIGEFSSRVEISLASRDEMGFRMLIGRNAIKKHLLVDPGHAYLLTHRGH